MRISVKKIVDRIILHAGSLLYMNGSSEGHDHVPVINDYNKAMLTALSWEEINVLAGEMSGYAVSVTVEREGRISGAVIIEFKEGAFSPEGMNLNMESLLRSVVAYRVLARLFCNNDAVARRYEEAAALAVEMFNRSLYKKTMGRVRITPHW